MKRISEVKDIVGVTRRTLQEYDRIGLLKPTTKTEGGYWLYDDEAIETLCLIQVFVEAGYKRKHIKSILESPNIDFMTECDNLILFLQEKQNKINGMIALALAYKTIVPKLEKLPTNGQTETIANDKSFSKYTDFIALLRGLINELGYVDSSDVEWYNQCLSAIFDLILIGRLSDKSVDAVEVQNEVMQVFQAAIPIIVKLELDLDEQWDSERIQKLLFEEIPEKIHELFDEPDVCEFIVSLLGASAPRFILEAIQVFCNRKVKTENNEEEDENAKKC